MPRLFFALLPEPCQQLTIAASARPWLQSRGGTAVPVRDLHLTLCFLGEVGPKQQAALLQVADSIEPQRLKIRLSHLDYWRNARVLCLLAQAGDTGLPALSRLARQLRAAAQSTGSPQEARRFRAHVTVARKIPAEMVRGVDWPQAIGEPLPFHANGFVLLESRPDSTRARYVLRRQWPATS